MVDKEEIKRNSGFRIGRAKRTYMMGGKLLDEYSYFICLAYYDKNGFIGSVSRGGIAPYGVNVEGLAEDVLSMREAFYLPIVDVHKVPEPGYRAENDVMTKSFNLSDPEQNKEFWEKLSDELQKIDPQEQIAFNDKEEKERLRTEKNFNYFIKEFENKFKVGENFKLDDFYKNNLTTESDIL